MPEGDGSSLGFLGTVADPAFGVVDVSSDSCGEL
jgi:hypothetical protein